MIIAGDKGYDVRPVGDLALAVRVIADRQNGPVGPQAHGVIIAGGNSYDIRPVGDFAPAVIVSANRHDGSIRPQAHGVITAGGDGHDIRPVGDIALAVRVIADRQNGPVGPQTHGVPASGNGLPPGRKTRLDLNPCLLRLLHPLGAVAVLAQGGKRGNGAVVVLGGKEGFGCGISGGVLCFELCLPGGGNPVFRIPVLPQGLKRGDSAIEILGGKEGFGCGISCGVLRLKLGLLCGGNPVFRIPVFPQGRKRSNGPVIVLRRQQGFSLRVGPRPDRLGDLRVIERGEISAAHGEKIVRGRQIGAGDVKADLSALVAERRGNAVFLCGRIPAGKEDPGLVLGDDHAVSPAGEKALCLEDGAVRPLDGDLAGNILQAGIFHLLIAILIEEDADSFRIDTQLRLQGPFGNASAVVAALHRGGSTQIIVLRRRLEGIQIEVLHPKLGGRLGSRSRSLGRRLGGRSGSLGGRLGGRSRSLGSVAAAGTERRQQGQRKQKGQQLFHGKSPLLSSAAGRWPLRLFSVRQYDHITDAREEQARRRSFPRRRRRRGTPLPSLSF